MLLSGDEAIIETDRCAWTLLIAFLADNVEKPSHLLDISNTRNIMQRLNNIRSFLGGDQGSAKQLLRESFRTQQGYHRKICEITAQLRQHAI